jgi:hypothetical protein
VQLDYKKWELESVRDITDIATRCMLPREKVSTERERDDGDGDNFLIQSAVFGDTGDQSLTHSIVAVGATPMLSWFEGQTGVRIRISPAPTRAFSYGCRLPPLSLSLLLPGQHQCALK